MLIDYNVLAVLSTFPWNISDFFRTLFFLLVISWFFSLKKTSKSREPWRIFYFLKSTVKLWFNDQASYTYATTVIWERPNSIFVFQMQNLKSKSQISNVKSKTRIRIFFIPSFENDIYSKIEYENS